MKIIRDNYQIKAKKILVFICWLQIVVAVWLDIGCFMQGTNPGIQAALFTAIGPFFLCLICKEKYIVKGNKLTRIFFFFERESIEISSIRKIDERFDILEGRHLMIYVTGQEDPVFDMDTSCLDTKEFEDDIEKRRRRKN